MEFNVKKCKVMHLGHNNMEQEYYMNGHKLEVTEEERDLGVIVSRNLKPASQCKRAARTAQTVLSQISRAFHYRDRHVFIRLYVQYVRPHLEFAVPAWSHGLKLTRRSWRRSKDEPSRWCQASRPTPTRTGSRNWASPLEERRHQADMAQTYKIVKEKDMVNKETWFKSVTETGRATRSAADSLNLRPQQSRLEIRRHFFSQRVVEDWNGTPAGLKQAVNVKSFMNGYRTYREKMVERT
jgi:hypothetical protein